MERKAPDGYEETMAIVKAVREFVDVAKGRAPTDVQRERREEAGMEAMRHLWRVYGLDRSTTLP